MENKLQQIGNRIRDIRQIREISEEEKALVDLSKQYNFVFEIL